MVGMAEFAQIVLLSLGVSVAGVALAACLGIPLAVVLTLCSFPGHRALVIGVNALIGLPPVVLGMVLYLLLFSAGPLGALGLVFTPVAIVIAQAILATPIVTALAHRGLAARWSEFGRALQACGASPLRATRALLAMSRRPLTRAVLAGFGRVISELGAVLMIGGNIAARTRTMTTAIASQTASGNVGLVLALGLVLLGISVAVSASVLVLAEDRV
jgi:tungstate transport system permease protein